MEPVRTVGGLLVDGQGRVLLGLRAAWKRAWAGHWDSIGGHVEADETLEEALTRELQEEIGVTPTALLQLAELAEAQPERHGRATHHIFAVTAWIGEPANRCDEHTELRWFSVEEVRRLPNLAACDYPRLIDEALAARTPS